MFSKLHQIKEIRYNCEFLCWLKTSSSCLHLRLKKNHCSWKKKKFIHCATFPDRMESYCRSKYSTCIVVSTWDPVVLEPLWVKSSSLPNPHTWFLRSTCFLSNFALGGFVKYFCYLSWIWIKMDKQWCYYD